MIVENHPLYFSNIPIDETLPFLKVYKKIKKSLFGKGKAYLAGNQGSGLKRHGHQELVEENEENFERPGSRGGLSDNLGNHEEIKIQINSKVEEDGEQLPRQRSKSYKDEAKIQKRVSDNNVSSARRKSSAKRKGRNFSKN